MSRADWDRATSLSQALLPKLSDLALKAPPWGLPALRLGLGLVSHPVSSELSTCLAVLTPHNRSENVREISVSRNWAIPDSLSALCILYQPLPFLHRLSSPHLHLLVQNAGHCPSPRTRRAQARPLCRFALRLVDRSRRPPGPHSWYVAILTDSLALPNSPGEANGHGLVCNALATRPAVPPRMPLL